MVVFGFFFLDVRHDFRTSIRTCSRRNYFVDDMYRHRPTYIDLLFSLYSQLNRRQSKGPWSSHCSAVNWNCSLRRSGNQTPDLSKKQKKREIESATKIEHACLCSNLNAQKNKFYLFGNKHMFSKCIFNSEYKVSNLITQQWTLTVVADIFKLQLILNLR